jgi:hypothetical protein
MRPQRNRRSACVLAAVWAGILFVGAGFRVLADCASFGLPFADLGSETTFCAAIAEAYYTGLTNGTSATTYSPADDVTREQMAAFIGRTLDASLYRGARRAAIDQWSTTTPHYDLGGLGLTSLGGSLTAFARSDGTDVWVANLGGTVSRVRASDGKLLETWTGATGAFGIVVAMGRVFVSSTAGNLYMIDPSQSAGAVTTVATGLGSNTEGIAFDGNRIWTTCHTAGSISIVAPGSTLPWSVTGPITTGFSAPLGILFDGSNVWVTDYNAATLLKLDSNGGILQTVNVGPGAWSPVFDGRNIWVPSVGDNSLTVVRASDGTVLKTFSAANGDANGMSLPTSAAFDGQRIVVANYLGGLSLFKATDLSTLGNVATPGITNPFGICSDGRHFWVTDANASSVGRF